MNTIYRVEDENGIGPYRTSKSPEYPFDDQDPQHPAPPIDGVESPSLYGQNNADYRFGFKSLKQLRAWFDAPRQAWLKKHDFHIAEYEIPTIKKPVVFQGHHQLAFKANEARRRAVKPWFRSHGIRQAKKVLA